MPKKSTYHWKIKSVDVANNLCEVVYSAPNLPDVTRNIHLPDSLEEIAFDVTLAAPLEEWGIKPTPEMFKTNPSSLNPEEVLALTGSGVLNPLDKSAKKGLHKHLLKKQIAEVLAEYGLLPKPQ